MGSTGTGAERHLVPGYPEDALLEEEIRPDEESMIPADGSYDEAIEAIEEADLDMDYGREESGIYEPADVSETYSGEGAIPHSW